MLRVWVNLKYRAPNIWFCPTSVTNMALLAVASETFLTTSPICIGPSAGKSSLEITLSYSFSSHTAKLSIHAVCFFFSNKGIRLDRVALASPRTETSVLTFLSNSEASMSK